MSDVRELEQAKASGKDAEETTGIEGQGGLLAEVHAVTGYCTPAMPNAVATAEQALEALQGELGEVRGWREKRAGAGRRSQCCSVCIPHESLERPPQTGNNVKLQASDFLPSWLFRLLRKTGRHDKHNAMPMIRIS